MVTEHTTRSDMATVKLLESGKKIGQMLGRLKKTYLSSEDMREIITVVSAEPRVTSFWNQELMYIQREGILAGLEWDERFLELDSRGRNPDAKYDRNALEREFRHLYPHWEARPGERYLPSYMGVTREYADEHIDSENDKEPWLCPIIRDNFKATVDTQWTLMKNGLDALSQIGAMISVDDADSADHWEAFSDNVWTAWAETKGNNAVLKGGVKRGKTNFALLLAEKFMAKGYLVVGNIPVQNPPEHYKYCPNLSTMLTEICNARLKNLKVFIIFDEAGLFWAKIDTTKGFVREMTKLVLIYGKLHANLLIISHRGDVPSAVAQTIIAEFEKTSTKNVFVSIDDGIPMRPRLIKQVPPTTLTYDPDAIQWFAANMICSEIFEYMSRIPDGENQWEAMLKYIPTHTILAKEESSSMNHKDMAKSLKAEGMGVSEIARTLKEPKTTVFRWISEEKAVEDAEKKLSKDSERDGTAETG